MFLACEAYRPSCDIVILRGLVDKKYLIASTIRKSGEVNLRQLDRESRKEFDVAKSAEIQSWLRYEAVTAALRSQYHHLDIMKMRWVLRY